MTIFSTVGLAASVSDVACVKNITKHLLSCYWILVKGPGNDKHFWNNSNSFLYCSFLKARFLHSLMPFVLNFKDVLNFVWRWWRWSTCTVAVWSTWSGCIWLIGPLCQEGPPLVILLINCQNMSFFWSVVEHGHTS